MIQFNTAAFLCLLFLSLTAFSHGFHSELSVVIEAGKAYK